jgi:predicted RecB family nuclease
MKTYLDKPLYSAKDLLVFLGCTHATALDLQVMGGTGSSPGSKEDQYLDLLKQKGIEHEEAFLQTLRTKGGSIIEIQRTDSIEEMTALTCEAMHQGADYIYQGALTLPGWHGYSDFLIKVPVASDLGAYSYEVVDTKLARTAKPKHVVQLSLYSQMVASIQGRTPDNIHVVVGDGSMVSLRLHDFIYYCNHLRGRFDRFVIAGEQTTVAEKCPHCSMCHWSERCAEEWDTAGNLRLVAGLSSLQALKLRAAGIDSIDALATITEETPVARMQSSTLVRLRSQAALQVFNRTTKQNKVELLPCVERCGFARLPLPNAGDLFFDMEGDPNYDGQGSLEYLFGFHYQDDGQDRFTAFWARDRKGERRAFEDALDFITSRLEKYPAAYVYHYASYEQIALKRLARDYGGSSRHLDALLRLAQSYGTRENEVDDLLRNRKMVDLYKVVREAIQTSEPAYSLKNLEVFFAERRTEDIKSGSESIVAFEKWIKTRDESLLKGIEDYNAVDCRSTRLCRDWLISLRPDEVTWFDPVAERSADEATRDQERREDDARINAMCEALVAGTDGEEYEWRELLGCLLQYHRREAGNEWRQYFERLDPSTDLVADSDSIGCLEIDATHQPKPDKRSTIWRLKFPEQDFKLGVGDKPVRTDTEKEAGEIVALNQSERWLEIRVGPSRPPFKEQTSLIPAKPRVDKVKRAAIDRYVQAVIDGRQEEYAALTSVLRRDRPRLSGGYILGGVSDQTAETVNAIARMDRSHLVIQGPPGCGKTYVSAHAIVALIADRKRIGVMSMSHKAINNLLHKVEEVAHEKGVSFTGIKRSNDEEQCLNGSIITDEGDNAVAFAGGYDIVGGTSWLFASPDMNKKLDYLFIDEAGQVSLADVIASGQCAENIILVGDQMQLPQVSKGKHPSGSGVSGLEYLMRDWATVPPDRGVFLERTWRMHPRLCRFVSDAFYDGRLESAECTNGQMLSLRADCDGILAATGLKFISIEHSGNSQKSSEEAMALDRAYRSLLGQTWVNQRGETRVIGTDDILVVSPYNMQVNLLKQRLPNGARVGTVDKFQGQEAAAVLVSMASSSADEAPRGIDFLFSRNRLNVAVSRARCLSVIFCSPALLDLVCTDLERMKLVNTVCWAKEFTSLAHD